MSDQTAQLDVMAVNELQRQRIAELEAESAEQRKRLNEYASSIGTGSQCKSCGRFYLHREGCQPCAIVELQAQLKEAREVLRWCKPIRDDITKRRDAFLQESSE